MKRVWVRPEDGFVYISTHGSKHGEECYNSCMRILGEKMGWAHWIYYDVSDNDVLRIAKQYRSKRHAWRFSNTSNVHVDETVPDPPDPREEVVRKIDQAKTLEEVKIILKEHLAK